MQIIKLTIYISSKKNDFYHTKIPSTHFKSLKIDSNAQISQKDIKSIQSHNKYINKIIYTIAQ